MSEGKMGIYRFYAPAADIYIMWLAATYANGYTVYDAEGGWKEPSGYLHAEPVRIIEVFSVRNKEMEQKVIDSLLDIGEQAVAFTFNNTPYFVTKENYAEMGYQKDEQWF